MGEGGCGCGGGGGGQTRETNQTLCGVFRGVVCERELYRQYGIIQCINLSRTSSTLSFLAQPGRWGRKENTRAVASFGVAMAVLDAFVEYIVVAG